MGGKQSYPRRMAAAFNLRVRTSPAQVLTYIWRKQHFTITEFAFPKAERSDSWTWKIITRRSCPGHSWLLLPPSGRCPGIAPMAWGHVALQADKSLKPAQIQIGKLGFFFPPITNSVWEILRRQWLQGQRFHSFPDFTHKWCCYSNTVHLILGTTAFSGIQGKMIRSHKLWNMLLRFTGMCSRYPEHSLNRKEFDWAQQIQFSRIPEWNQESKPQCLSVPALLCLQLQHCYRTMMLQHSATDAAQDLIKNGVPT